MDGSMTLQGKGFFTLDLSGCEGGDAAAFVTTAKEAGLTHIFIKIADGVEAYNLDPRGVDSALPFVQALQLSGLTVWGWHKVYGQNPLAEATIAIQRAQSLQLSGYAIEAGTEFEKSGSTATAAQFMGALCGALNLPIALNSYRFPNYHPEFPWAAFLIGCDYNMPRLFWEQDHNAGEQLRESKRQCDALPHARPFIPSASAFTTPGWAPQPADIGDFLDTAQMLGLPAVNFYHWQSCRLDLPRVWTSIAEFSWPVPAADKMTMVTSHPDPLPIVITDPFAIEFVASLNTRHPDRIIGLYDPAAVRTWVDETLHGIPAIRDAFAALFTNLPNGIAFSLTHSQMDKDVHYITWKAGPLNGETTLVLKNGKIIQDYTFIAR
jgi:hypothetical protein